MHLIRTLPPTIAAWLVLLAAVPAAEFSLVKQWRDRESGTVAQTPETWDSGRTALIICDMWDSHHSGYAARRTGELAPAIDALARLVRDGGGLVIHAPSDTMGFYADHPARARAQAAPKAPDVPEDIGTWCHWKDPTEEEVGYPIDASDGGEDDSPDDKAAWMEQLATEGRDPKAPWKRQIAAIAVDADKDAITDRGDEVWNLLHASGIDDVLLAGVHTNMCVLGRPFGLRQLARNGKNVVLVRDLTDSMYNPAMPPHVNHFHGTDLVIAHIEQHVCPTVTSDHLTGGQPFHFPGDPRKTLVAALAESEYKTVESVPPFMESELQESFRIDYALPHPDNPNSLPELETKLAGADVLFLSVRRRALPENQLSALKEFVGRGGPVVAIRTASHAFSLRGTDPPAGHATWDSFDADILGGNYHNHHGNKLATEAWVPDTAPADHPILEGIDRSDPFPTGSSLYQNHPIKPDTTVLLMGRAESVAQAEPVAWTHTSPAGARVFYTSLGHPDDFDAPPFRTILRNACHWVTAKPD